MHTRVSVHSSKRLIRTYRLAFREVHLDFGLVLEIFEGLEGASRQANEIGLFRLREWCQVCSLPLDGESGVRRERHGGLASSWEADRSGVEVKVVEVVPEGGVESKLISPQSVLAFALGQRGETIGKGEDDAGNNVDNDGVARESGGGSWHSRPPDHIVHVTNSSARPYQESFAELFSAQVLALVPLLINTGPLQSAQLVLSTRSIVTLLSVGTILYVKSLVFDSGRNAHTTDWQQESQ